MRHHAVLSLQTFLLLLCANMATAQAPSLPSRPEVELKKLSAFVGKWTAEGDLKPGPMGPGGKTTVSESCEWTSGGYAILCHETSTMPGMGTITHVSIM